MLTLTLQRKTRTGNAVKGAIQIPFSSLPVGSEKADRNITIPTLENADYLIPAGTYPLIQTYSPKFKKLLPLIDQVPDREGIRIHQGSKPEHSTGCILVDPYGLSCIEALFNRITKYYNYEQIQIIIRDA